MYWKLTLAQHPMYILIKEDTLCAERTPPWGAPDIESYIARLRQNIATLRKYPQVKIGYEWSGLELELLKQDAPEVFAEMMDLAHNGQTTFYNGTYSQPHLQTLSSEANYRQFEWGARVYRELCDNWQVKAYAHQESSVNEQTPQLLKAFGIKFGVLPHFSSTMTFIDGGEMLFHSRFGTMFMHGEEFANWQGLDGTLEPLYLEEPNHLRTGDWLNFQEMLGYTHNPPIVVEIPDLIDVDEEWLAERAKADFALLDDTLEERFKAFPPRFKTRFYTNWSYIEGIRAEELSRNNFKAEVSALRAEALNTLAFALINRPADSTDSIWKQILTTQHHDVYCFCAPELRAKSVVWLQEAEAAAERLVKEAAGALVKNMALPNDGQPLVVFSTVPHPLQGIVTADVENVNPIVLDSSGKALPTEITPLPDGKARVRFVTDLPGLGYVTYQLKDGGKLSEEDKLKVAFTFKNHFYSATVQPDGTFTSLQVKPGGEELLVGPASPGNLLAARDSTGLGPQHEGTFDVTKWPRWDPSGRGPELTWTPNGPARLRTSPMGATFIVDGDLGPTVKGTLEVSFYHELARIDLDWSFTFDEASIGHFFDDDTKLRVQWPLSFKGNIHHDISFGVVDSRDERPFLPSTWTDISDGKVGFAYLHQGTIKHWVSENTLYNLFAWGEYTDAIGNRLDMVRWPKCFDQRLRGTHTIHAAIMPHAGDWRAAGLVSTARSYTMPPIAVAADSHAGTLPSAMTVMRIENPEIAATAVRVEDDQVLCRLYSVAKHNTILEANIQGLRQVQLTSLMGKTLDAVNPYQIAHAKFTTVK